MKFISINISEEYKSFVWTPAKTGSEHALLILSHYGFETMTMDYERKKIRNSDFPPKNSHQMDLFDGHENYDLICTTRNPLKRIFSGYLYSSKFENKSPKGFKVYFGNQINDFSSPTTQGINNLPRIPDYYLRLENLYEDYLKIPFIRESKFAQCGVLEELCKIKRNFTSDGLNIKECYTEDMIDLVYTRYRDYFDLHGYKPEV